MLRPVYHSLLERYRFEESGYSNPWYKKSYLQPSQENNEAKILWDIPWKLEKCPMNGANRPNISVLDKKNKEWIIIEGKTCNPGKITMRTKHKKDKYIDLKLQSRTKLLKHFTIPFPPTMFFWQMGSETLVKTTL